MLTPQTPSAPGSYASANLTDLRRAPGHRPWRVVRRGRDGHQTRPFINVELRALQDGDLHLVVTDTNGS